MFERSLKDPTCQHVVLGVCHDNGYVRLLEQISDLVDRQKVTLLKSFETGHEFATLSFGEIELPELFRRQTIRGNTGPRVHRGSQSSSAEAHNLLLAIGTNAADSISRTKGTYAAMAVGPGQSGINAGQANSANGAIIPVLLNSKGQRIDSRLPLASPNAVSQYAKKIDSGDRFCNGFFLASQCPCGNTGLCTFQHSGLSAEEVAVMRVEKRSLPCKLGLACRKTACFYGHHCPQPDCGAKICKFGFSADMHSVSRK